MRFRHMLASVALGVVTLATSGAKAVEIEYWQYVFDTRVKAMTQLIAKFQEANPDIKVKQTTFPYADYQTKVAAAILAGQGPDVVQLFYGWTDNFIAGKMIRPLRAEAFPAANIERDFFPIVSAMKRGNDYYGLPTAVRSLALFYNKKAFKDAGLDPNNPPKTLEELVAAAEKTTKRDGSGNITSAGMTLDMGGQDHQWWREVLIRQFGGVPYTENDTKKKHKVGQTGFMDEGQADFRAGLAAMTIDGTFRLGSFGTIKSFEWGVTELPANAQGVRSNYASYFANAITTKAEGEKLAAAEKFLTYVSSPEAMKIWMEVVGELPARRAAALTPENAAHPIYGPFLKGLEYAHTTLFKDEAAQRQVAIDMANRVLIGGEDPKTSLAKAAEAEQAILDRAKR